MSGQSDLEQLQQRVERSKRLVHLSEIKVEQLEATVRRIQDFQRNVALTGRGKKKSSTTVA
jgi:hypothetical protein